MVLKTALQEIKTPVTNSKLYSTFPEIQEQASTFSVNDVFEAGSKDILYVNQGEYAIIPGKDKSPYLIGSDDATTCHIVIFMNPYTHTVCISHIDEKEMLDKSLEEMLYELKMLDGDLSNIKLYVLGGYSPGKNYIKETKLSQKLSYNLLKFFINSMISFDLELWFTCDMNTKVENGIPRPIFYGISLNRLSGEVLPTVFKEHLPCQTLRNASSWANGRDKLIKIYDHTTSCIVVAPFYGWDKDRFLYYGSLPDDVILNNFSTSPAVEPPTFCSRLRQIFLLLGSSNNLFPNDCEKYFKLKKDGTWEEIENM